MMEATRKVSGDVVSRLEDSLAELQVRCCWHKSPLRLTALFDKLGARAASSYALLWICVCFHVTVVLDLGCASRTRV